MEAGFDASKFTYTTKNPEMLEVIENILKKWAVPRSELESKLTEVGKEMEKKKEEFKKKFFDMMNSPKWSEYTKEGNCVGYTMKGDGGLICTKSVGILPCSPIEAMAYIDMDKYKADYDELYIETEEVESFSTHMRLIVQRFRGKMLVSNREFLFLSTVELNPSDGSIQIIATSVEDPRPPVKKSHVRGKIITAGWILKPAEGGKCDSTYVTSVDVSGSVPTFMANMAGKNHASYVKRFTDAYLKRFGK